LYILELELEGELFKDEKNFEIEFRNSNEFRKKWLKFKEKKHNPSEIWKRIP